MPDVYRHHNNRQHIGRHLRQVGSFVSHIGYGNLFQPQTVHNTFAYLTRSMGRGEEYKMSFCYIHNHIIN